ncbi:hypothetical protein KUV23_06115 [Algoriphagus marincola]|uniref:Uncharacterized protein n=1 Tax=Algoriphagus marincola TaxID=264027 RepID=A0ABS7N2I2_9BACT|nr:hypothetical protein [Algoriphagus marincola]MBY5950539.1 hypothetical protein [Algoriphagus marincola]
MNKYFNQVIQAFSNMDIELIEDLLDPTIPYSDVPIETFLKNLDKAFKSFREEGDTFLISQPGSCCNLYCNPESIRTAYRFVGNKTRLYLDFRFVTEITEDLSDYRIKDIYSCYSFKCHEPLDWYANDIAFCFYEDEKVGFQKSPELLIYMEKQNQALDELQSISGEMTESDLRIWLFRHQPTYEFFKALPEKGYYSWIGFMMEYSTSADQIELVEKFTHPSFLEEILSDDYDSEESLIQRVLKVEKILIENDRPYLIWLWKNESRCYFRNYDYFLVGGIFESFAKLWSWFKPRQLKLLQKYYALTPEETEEFSTDPNHPDSTDEIYTLTFHLETRKRSRMNGTPIPFGLWNEEQRLPF